MSISFSRLGLVIGLAALVACGTEARVSASFAASPPVALDMLTLDLDDGTRTWRWTADDFSSDGGGNHATPAVRTAQEGSLTVTIRLVSHGVVLTQGTVEVPLQSDWQWQVEVRTATEDPQRGCFGCAGARAFPLPPEARPTGQDSLWIVWGGNSIKHPVVY